MKQSDYLVRSYDIVFNDARSFLPRVVADQKATLLHPKLGWWLGLWLVLHPGYAPAQTKPEKPIRQDPQFTEARKYIRTQLASQSIPSIVVAVAVHNKIIWEEGFGNADIENGKAATPDTLYYLASVTKSITGTAILVLRDHGKIDLDQSVNDYLSLAKLHSPMWDSSQATVRLVASHIAGLTTYSRKCAVDDPKCRVSTEMAIKRYGVLFWPPGDHFDYSNLGYGILGEVVANSSGKSLAAFLHDEVFMPLGMKSCSLPVASQSNAAAQYDSASHERTPFQLSDTPGASSAFCSVHDLALFGLFAMKSHLADQKQILSDKSLDEMLHPTVQTGDGETYGFGWSLQPDYYGFQGLYAQGGTNDSFAVLQMIPTEGIVVAVMANTGTELPFEIVKKILSELLPTFKDNVEKTATTPKASEIQGQNRTDSPLFGKWVGTVVTWKGDVPVALSISSCENLAKVGSRSGNWAKVSNTEISASRFYGVVQADWNTPDGPTPPYSNEIEVYLRGEFLVGAVTTKDGPQLPYWVKLRKSP